MTGQAADSWQVLPAGTFALDGGAMFGVVPRVLWQKVLPPDSEHRVRLGLNCLLVRSGPQVILVETGIGRTGDATFGRRHAPSDEDGLASALAAAGVEPEEVTDVVNTHLHWDHAGGNCRRRPDGSLEPAFPRATYHIQRGEWQFARQASARMKGSYRADDFEPLDRAGRLLLLDGPATIAPGVQVRPAPGHLPFMQVVTVHTETGTLFFPSDLVPTRHHLAPAWGMSFDCEPLVVAAEKRRWLERAARKDWTLLFYHDADAPLARVESAGGRFSLRPAEGD
ncbi:MAG: MBL fold metallo-hydrolase [Acidobacteria bacterium]|nr:MAG: MBL fold metallo-hydrolase [Acidobacteriota bacterium]